LIMEVRITLATRARSVTHPQLEDRLDEVARNLAQLLQIHEDRLSLEVSKQLNAVATRSEAHVRELGSDVGELAGRICEIAVRFEDAVRDGIEVERLLRKGQRCLAEHITDNSAAIIGLQQDVTMLKRHVEQSDKLISLVRKYEDALTVAILSRDLWALDMVA